METMRIEYNNGKVVEVDNEDEAIKILDQEFPDAVYGDWEYNERAHQRMLVWENEEIAGEPGTGDDGSHAVAEIVKEVICDEL